MASVEVKGLRELGENMRKLSAKVSNRIASQATNAAAQLVKKQAKVNIQTSPSVVTRSLLESVIVKKIPKSQHDVTSMHAVTVRGRGKKIKKTGMLQKAAPHAHFVEFGTVKMPAEPFLAPAFEQEKGFAVAAMKKKLADGIAKAVK